jgi:hypothetical protein
VPRYKIRYSIIENYEYELSAKDKDQALEKFNDEICDNGYNHLTFIDSDTANQSAELISKGESVEL